MTESQRHSLRKNVDPLTSSDNYGIELFERTVKFVTNLKNWVQLHVHA